MILFFQRHLLLWFNAIINRAIPSNMPNYSNVIDVMMKMIIFGWNHKKIRLDIGLISLLIGSLKWDEFEPPLSLLISLRRSNFHRPKGWKNLLILSIPLGLASLCLYSCVKHDTKVRPFMRRIGILIAILPSQFFCGSVYL